MEESIKYSSLCGARGVAPQSTADGRHLWGTTTLLSLLLSILDITTDYIRFVLKHRSMEGVQEH
jgi:hypothetical protein